MQQNEKDALLWEVAKKRATFKRHLFTYVMVNLMLIGIWYFTNYMNDREIYFWPIWPLLGWGIGIASHYYGAYYSNLISDTEREYEKLEEREKATMR